MNLNYKSILIFIIVFFYFLTSNTYAATGPENFSELEEKTYFNIYPERPNIGDTITISAEMYGTNISDSAFDWKINNKSFKSGVGLNKINFVLDKKSTVDLEITTNYGSKIQKQFVFDPKKIILIWESRTYTPPFYKGKSMYTPESSIILNAINLDQENPLTNTYNNYKWSVDGVVKGSVSGAGYSSFSYKGDILKKEPLFSVVVSALNSYKDTVTKTYNNEAVLRIPTLDTEIISYEKSPLLGILFNKTIKPQFRLSKNEATIVSYPFYYGINSTLATVYSWYINDVQIKNSSNELSFRKKKDDELSRLSIKIKNQNSILQSKDILYIIDTNK